MRVGSVDLSRVHSELTGAVCCVYNLANSTQDLRAVYMHRQTFIHCIHLPAQNVTNILLLALIHLVKMVMSSWTNIEETSFTCKTNN